MRITLLCGGPSAERDVSLVGGEAVAGGLREAGHEVFIADISPADLSALDRPCDVIFPVLHGAFGESGELQEILEARSLAFVGSGSEASRLGMDKIASKEIWRDAGLPTPGWGVVDSVNAEAKGQCAAPCVVKAIDSGSSIDVFICRNDARRDQAVETLVKKLGRCMVEQFIEGVELTVGLLDGKALPPIRIETSREFFDYQAKYTKGGATHSFDLKLPPAVAERCQLLAEQASALLGCRDLARVDFMIDRDHQPYLLEINTLPGFTPVSLLPEAAGRAGIGFVELVDRLAKMALKRAGATAL